MNLQEFRCANCGHLICFERIFVGRIEAKCSSCGYLNYFENYNFDEIFSGEQIKI